MLKKQVLSKNNISNLYQSIIKNNRYDANQKKFIANKIINSLKQVSQKVDENKVNQQNINKILNQINNITLNKINQEINYSKLKNFPNDSGPQISQLSMERDFLANPYSSVKVYDRPQATASSFKQTYKPKDRLGAKSQNKVPDREFKMNSQKDSNLLEDRLSQIQAERETMSSKRATRQIPKELQPISTNPNSQPRQMKQNNRSLKKNEYSQDNYHLTNDTGEDNFGNLGNKPGSIDDVFKNEITDLDSYQEDSRPLEARLSDLKNLRDVEIPDMGELPPPIETNIKMENEKKNKPKNKQVNFKDQQTYQPQTKQEINYPDTIEDFSEDQESVNFDMKFNPTKNIPNIDFSSLEKKINSLQQQIYNLDNVQKFQLVVDSRKNNYSKTNYRHNLSRELNNISKIELVNYSIPSNYYNINNSNNEFIYYVFEDNKDIKKEIILENGFYSIEKILEVLNEKTELIFSCDLNQKIKINSDKNFRLENNNLVKINLGFNKKDDFTNELLADNMWDLRQPSYFLLYVDNIEPNNPLAILNINGHSFGKIELNYPLAINYLQIRIVDEFGNLVDFQGRYHTLTFVLETR